MKQFYILSLKWTTKDAPVFTLWRSNDSGYTLYEETAGRYTEDRILENQPYYNNNKSTMAVDVVLIEDDFVRLKDFGHWVESLPNTPEIRKKLGIKLKQLK